MNNFKSAIAEVGTTWEEIYAVPAGKKSILLEIDAANVYIDYVTVSVGIIKGAGSVPSFYIVKNAPIPQGSTLQVVSGQKIILEEDGQNTRIVAQTSEPAGVHIFASILEDVQ